MLIPKLGKNSISAYVTFVMLVISMILTPAVNAEPSTLDSKPFKHVALDQHLKELIEYFVSSYGVNASFSESFINEPYPLINGQFEVSKGTEFLDKIGSLYNLSWYFDGRILHVTVGSDQEKQLHRVTKEESENIKNTLKQMDAYSGNFSWKYLDSIQMLEVYGQEVFLDNFVSTFTMIQSVPKKGKKGEVIASSLPTDFIVRTFKLRYASAEDTHHSFRDRISVSQGVVSKLRSLFNVPASGSDNKNTSTSVYGLSTSSNFNTLTPYESSKESDLNALAQQQLVTPMVSIGGKMMPMPPMSFDTQSKQTSDTTSNEPPLQTSPAQAKPKPYITYDNITNQVIVYDQRQKMPLYEKAIAAMDAIARQIQIEVTVIEVAVEKLNELGVDWTIAGNDGSIGVNTGIAGLAGASGASAGLSIAQSILQSGEKTNVLTGQVQQIIGNVRALAESGDGQVISQPAVMTIDNTPALINNTRTFFVRLSGEREVDLFDIEVGSVLAVKPRIINTSTPRQIHLEVRIIDGNIEDLTVDDIPLIKKNTIETRSVIEEKTSLIVGGYFFDSLTTQSGGVPVLKDIPIIKRAFSTERETRRKMMKMFIITPTIIDQDYDSRIVAKEIREHVNENKHFPNSKLVKPVERIFD